MARGRNKPTTPVTQTVTQTETQTTNTNTNTGRGNMSLDQDKINSLLQSGRNRGGAQQEVKEFIASGSAGAEVSLTSGRFAGKNAKQVVAALNNARKASNANGLVFAEGPDILVRQDKDEDGEHVYLINTKLLEG